jgi:hypothetical protein
MTNLVKRNLLLDHLHQGSTSLEIYHTNPRSKVLLLLEQGKLCHLPTIVGNLLLTRYTATHERGMQDQTRHIRIGSSINDNSGRFVSPNHLSVPLRSCQRKFALITVGF